MKKKLVLTISVIVLIVLLIYTILGLTGKIRFPSFMDNILGNSDEMPDLERIPNMIKETHPTDIIILGDNIFFDRDVKNRQIDCINEENLYSESMYTYTFLVINDLNDTVELDEKEIELLSDKISMNGFCLVYLGKKYSTVWDSDTDAIAYVPGNLSYMYYSIDGYSRRSIGAWGAQEQELFKEYPNLLGDSLLYLIEEYLIDVN